MFRDLDQDVRSECINYILYKLPEQYIKVCTVMPPKHWVALFDNFGLHVIQKIFCLLVLMKFNDQLCCQLNIMNEYYLPVLITDYI